MKVKLIKKSVSLLLVLCMLISLVPLSVFAAAPDTSNDDFYKIVHLDCGRKYFSVTQIKAVIDEMAEQGLNQLELYLADNQGFRLALDSGMQISINGVEYDLTKCLGDGYMQDSTLSANDNHFKPSSDGSTTGYLTQSEMDEIIGYAKDKGIEIVPCINVPGHMGAILNPNRTDDGIDPGNDSPFTNLCYTSNGVTALSSIDLTNQNAVDFALAVTQLYVNYFAGRGCKFYSIGADEYGYDVGLSVSGLPAAGLYDEYVSFMNKCAEIIEGANMTPRAFNDAFCLDSTNVIDTDYQVYFWNGSATQLDAIEAAGYDVINTSQNIYWAVGSSWAELGTVTSNLKTFDYKTSFGGGEITAPVGAMMCVWNDVATYRTGDNIVSELTVDATEDSTASDVSLLALYADSLEAAGPVEIELKVGESYSESFTVDGVYTAAELATKYGFGSVVTATITATTPATSAGLASTQSTALTAGKQVIIGDANYYLTLDGTTLGTVAKTSTDAQSKAAVWTVESFSGNYTLKCGSYYLIEDSGYTDGTDLAVYTTAAKGWKLDGTNLQGAYYGNQYITLANGTPAATGTDSGVGVYEYSEATNGTTTFKLTGASVGSVSFTDNGTKYKVTVVSGEHTCDSNVAATCIKGASCSKCGAEQSTTLNENNHAGPVSTATCAAPSTCDACKETVAEKNSANHVGGTEVRGYIAPTETTKGYSGDTYCLGCNTMTVKGTDLDPVHTHAGGVATCINKAVCSTCGEEYGALDGTNHMGDRYVTNITATNTGTIYCSDCNGWIANGENIPNDPAAIYVTVPANGTASHTVDGALGTNGATGNTVDGLASYSVSIAETSVGGTGTGTYTAFDPTTLAVGSSQEVIFQAGTTTNYMTSTGYNTTDITAAGKWTITRVESGYTISCNGTYINTVGQVVAGILNGTADSVFQWDGSCFYFTSGGYNYYLFANAEYTWWVWYSPVNKGTPMVEGTSGGSGETVTKTTVTFTGGPTNGNDEVTIGGQKFIITVTGGNNPVIEGVNCEHEWEQKHDANGHWQYCAKCMTSTTKAAHSGGSATCTALAVCSTCNQTYGEVATHDYSEATCQTLATCSVCGATTGELGKHTGGSANCQSGAICSICSTEYTDKNTNNHVGPMVEVEGTYVAPTDDTDGKEADKTCSVCHVTVPGAVIPSLNSSVVEITVATGATVSKPIDNVDLRGWSDSTGSNPDTSIATITIDYVAADLGGRLTHMTAWSGNATVVIGNGTDKWLKYENGTFSVVSTSAAATQWTLEDNNGQNFGLKAPDGSGYLEINDASIGIGARDYGTDSLKIENSVLKRVQMQNRWISLDSGVTYSESATDVGVYSISQPTNQNSTINFTGVTPGTTYATIGGVRYKINVVDAALMNAVLATPTWMTNRKVSGFLDSSGNSISFYEKITAADHVDITSANGVALADVLPPEATTVDGSATDSNAIFWRGMRHSSVQVQGASTDFHQTGDVINYVRYDKDAGIWYGSADRTTWLDLTGYTLDIYYLQETAVTKEVTTEVVDWGPDYDSFTSDQWESSTYVLLDFAVALDGVGRHPALTAYPNNGDGTTVENQKTIAYHCTHTADDKTMEKDGTWQRRVDSIFAEETGLYEVYMITVTRTSDTPTETLGESYSPDVSAYTYNGEEKIIWTIDEATFTEKYGQTTTDGNVLGAFDIRPEGFDISSKDHKATMYRTVGGDPIVDYVQIYQNQGLLVTYYVRARKTEDSLTVHYRLEGSTEDFHQYYIAVQEGTFFDPGFNDDETNTETGLMHNTVENFYGNTHTVTSDLSDLFDVPAQYRTGMYQFNQHIDFKLEDGTIVNQENYSESMGKIKEVILYYGMDNTHFVPVDFGHHLTIDKDFFVHHVDENFTINSITVLPSPMTGYFHKYGNLTPYDEDHDGTYESYGYMPYYILDGHEDAYGFTLNMTDTVTGETATETHYVVFFPATTVYYEEFFMIRENALGGNWQIVQDGNEVSLSAFDYETDHQQDICHADTRDIYNYGRDDGINRENAPSNGTELVAKDNTAYAEFTFSGTGIEIYANSTLATSNAAVLIYSGTGDTKTLYKMFIVDTRLKEDTDENGNNIATGATDKLEELGTAYNVPIVTVTDMPYGTYTVRLGYVSGSAARTDGFRFDGFRVLEPLQDSYALPSADGLTAGYVYNEHFEYDPTFYELRDAVVAKATIPGTYAGDYADQIAPGVVHQVNAASSAVKAVVISDGGFSLDSNTSDEIMIDLFDNAAKNEIYLWPGQAIVFQVNNAYHLQVGMRAVNSTVDAKYFVAAANGVVSETTRTINTTTDMFYPMTYGSGSPTTEFTGDTVVITNNSASDSGAVLAITMLKCLPDQLSSGELLLDLNENDYTLALTALGYDETPVEDVPEETEPEVTEPEETEPEVTAPDVEFIGASLSLKGDIGLNFYVKLSDKILSDETAYMQFTVGGTTRAVPLSDGILDESDGSYRFSVALNAKNMGDVVTAQVYNEAGAVGASKTLSIKDYADYAIKNSNKGQLVKLMKAMLNYGAAAQVEFGYNLDNLVNADLDDADKTMPGTVDVGAFKHTISGSEDGITITSASLLLQSETKIRIYFTLVEGKSIADYTFTIDGETVTPVKTEGGEYYIEKANVAAKDLDTVYTFQLGGLTLTYSGMSYINQVQTHSGNDVNLMKLAKTLYEYCQAANVYFG